MGQRSHISLLVGTALLIASPACAGDIDGRASIKLKAGRLADALRDLSVRTGTGLLFETNIVGDSPSPAVSGSMTIGEALQRLLAGTGLWYRETSSGMIVISRMAALDQTPAIPEILVTGRRTHNTDIRRSENDIQPYQVTFANRIITSDTDSVDQFLRTRVTSNAELNAPSLDPAAENATNRSEVNFHGINETLVLVDGARMPGVPSQASA